MCKCCIVKDLQIYRMGQVYAIMAVWAVAAKYLSKRHVGILAVQTGWLVGVLCVVDLFLDRGQIVVQMGFADEGTHHR